MISRSIPSDEAFIHAPPSASGKRKNAAYDPNVKTTRYIHSRLCATQPTIHDKLAPRCNTSYNSPRSVAIMQWSMCSSHIYGAGSVNDTSHLPPKNRQSIFASMQYYTHIVQKCKIFMKQGDGGCCFMPERNLPKMGKFLPRPFRFPCEAATPVPALHPSLKQSKVRR